MNLPQQWEDVAQERVKEWEKEVRHQKLLSQLPQEPSLWRRWTGSGMVWVGTWLMRSGERMAHCECQECVSLAS